MITVDWSVDLNTKTGSRVRKVKTLRPSVYHKSNLLLLSSVYRLIKCKLKQFCRWKPTAFRCRAMTSMTNQKHFTCLDSSSHYWSTGFFHLFIGHKDSEMHIHQALNVHHLHSTKTTKAWSKMNWPIHSNVISKVSSTLCQPRLILNSHTIVELETNSTTFFVK